jgi:hypothetical protein
MGFRHLNVCFRIKFSIFKPVQSHKEALLNEKVSFFNLFTFDPVFFLPEGNGKTILGYRNTGSLGERIP